jgi:hypothetical protein
MNYKFILLILSALYTFGCNDEQAAGPGAANTYIKFFGAENIDLAYMLKQTADGGSVLLGSTEIINDEGISTFKIKVIKVDNNGNKLWQKLYPSIEEDEDGLMSLTGRSIIVVDDGYMIVGDSIQSDGSTKRSLLLMKINDSANDTGYEATALNYEDLTGDPSPYHVLGMDIIQDSDGNFRIISNVMNDAEVIGTIFSKINADFSFDSDDCNYEIDGKLALVRSLHEGSDETFIFGGTVRSTSIDNSVLRSVPSCFNGQGGGSDLVVTSPTDNYTAGQVIATTTGYAMVGTNVTASGQSDVFFVLFNSVGGVRDNTLMHYNNPTNEFKGIGDEDAFGHTIATTSDGGFIIGGETLQDTGGEEDMLLIKTDALGNIQWTKVIGNTNEERITHVEQADDGGYLLFGNTEFGGIDTMVLIKTDKNGNIN